MSIAPAISYALYGFGAIALFCLVLQTVWYWRKESRDKKSLAAFRRDFELVQRMFDNMHTLDKKWDGRTETIKQLLEQSVERNAALYERQRQLAEQVDDVERRLAAMQAVLPGVPSPEGAVDASRRSTAFPFVRSAKLPSSAMPKSPVDPEGARAVFRTLLKQSREEKDDTENTDITDEFNTAAEPPAEEA